MFEDVLFHLHEQPQEDLEPFQELNQILQSYKVLFGYLLNNLIFVRQEAKGKRGAMDLDILHNN